LWRWSAALAKIRRRDETTERSLDEFSESHRGAVLQERTDETACLSDQRPQKSVAGTGPATMIITTISAGSRFLAGESR
jgi:hypothetical protein